MVVVVVLVQVLVLQVEFIEVVIVGAVMTFAVVVVVVVVVTCYRFSFPVSVTSARRSLDESDPRMRRVDKEAANGSDDPMTAAWCATGACSRHSIQVACSAGDGEASR